MQHVLKKVIRLHGCLVQISKGIMYAHKSTVHSGRLIPLEFILPHPRGLFIGTIRPNLQNFQE